MIFVKYCPQCGAVFHVEEKIKKCPRCKEDIMVRAEPNVPGETIEEAEGMWRDAVFYMMMENNMVETEIPWRKYTIHREKDGKTEVLDLWRHGLIKKTCGNCGEKTMKVIYDIWSNNHSHVEYRCKNFSCRNSYMLDETESEVLRLNRLIKSIRQTHYSTLEENGVTYNVKRYQGRIKYKQTPEQEAREEKQIDREIRMDNFLYCMFMRFGWVLVLFEIFCTLIQPECVLILILTLLAFYFSNPHG